MGVPVTCGVVPLASVLEVTVAADGGDADEPPQALNRRVATATSGFTNR
jgi:hypothetical protein